MPHETGTPPPRPGFCVKPVMTSTLPALRPSATTVLPVSRLAQLQDRTNRDRLLAQLDQRLTIAQRKGRIIDITA
jgi:hypothetical protein